MAAFSRELHDFRSSLTAEIEKLNDRVKDLEQHVEERDGIIDQLSEELRQSRSEVSALEARVEEAEINSRLPCLILSGAAMAPRRAPRLEPPLPNQTAPAAVDPRPIAPADTGRDPPTVTSQSADRPNSGGPDQSAGRGGRERVAGRAGEWEEREDINALVISTLNQCLPGLGLAANDIDRAHSLPGPNNRVIVRFVRSGEGSARDRVMARRMELRGRELFINESLTKLRSRIFRSLLAAKRERRIYTVYSRGGHVFFKEQQHGVGKRVDTLERVRGLCCNPPWLGHHGGITFRVDLPVATRRSDPPAVRREAALRATAELPHPDVTIWSDGSARGGRNRAAQALIQFHHLNREETVRAPAGAVCSSLRAELTAMREAFAAVAGLEDGELASTKSGNIESFHTDRQPAKWKE
ncbi:hypothetical protein FJT64_013194 [Amphibalanus amphitrite]|uniref:Uncharacterized protein n=1 Tax=Amphibalanus amphitrite TaxID=1232801 RepID=A0A6A4VA49_AMPAM|nr:hypothetical protein FJT64_013194 [Amphibalanus amphitrite]